MKIFRWPIIASIAALGIISALEISLSSPLFAVLGFEYSALMGLALSLVCGIAEIFHADSNKIGVVGALKLSILLSTVPLIVSVISLPFLHNCSFGDGLLFYIEIAFPSAIFGGLFGLAFRHLIKNRKIALFSFITFWFITLFLSLLPGYFNPQLFTYGWQYGFFPGFIWDESLELTNVYLAARVEHLIFAALLISLSLLWQSANRTHWTHWAVFSLLLAAFITMMALNDRLGITVSHDALREDLSDGFQISPNCFIHYAYGSFGVEDSAKLDGDVRWYLHDIRRRFLLSDTTHAINIYIYPSTESFFEHVGSRVASIAKPWLGEVHITKQNLGSLKHELTHVLMREKGVFPFYASWSTGLTEGAAMSVEPEYDGIYTLDEHAAQIFQMKYATGVKGIMSFTGFAANASSKSYVLAGSFTRYLLSAYGPVPFDKVYSSLDFEKEYGKPIDTLQSEWKKWLAPLMTQLTSADSDHFRYYYDRKSIIFSPCLRRIGKLERYAGKAYDERHFIQAVNLYRDAIAEGGGISPLIGEAGALLRQDRLSDAILLLDTTSTPNILGQYEALDLERADLKALAGAMNDADSLYRAAENVKIDSRTFLAAYAHRSIVQSDIGREWLALLRREYTSGSNVSLSDLKEFNKMLSARRADSGFDRAAVALRYERSAIFERAKDFKQAVEGSPFSNGFPVGQNLTSGDSLAISLLALHFAQLPDASSATFDGEAYCPSIYRRAGNELTEELRAERNFLNSRRH